MREMYYLTEGAPKLPTRRASSQGGNPGKPRPSVAEEIEKRERRREFERRVGAVAIIAFQFVVVFLLFYGLLFLAAMG